MMNYFNFKEFSGRYLLTNDFGRYAFLEKEELFHFLKGDMDLTSGIGQELCDALFAYSGSYPAFELETKYLLRDSKNYVFTATSLFIFVVTTACNMNCCYCQAHPDEQYGAVHMDLETAERAVDIALASPNEHLSFEFQGGEPLLNFKAVKHIVEYAKSKQHGKDIQFSIVSNLTRLNDEILAFIIEHDIGVSTSIDGHPALHNVNRPYHDGSGTFADVKEAIRALQSAGVRVGAIQTTTKDSLSHAKELVDTYCDLGLMSLFLRPLTPLGCAKEKWDEIGYTAEEFVAFYKEALLHLIRKSCEGVSVQEGHAAIMLAKILHGNPVNYMELRSPCGASIGQMAFHANGDIFTCDEGRMLFEMGDNSFRLGNVHHNNYEELIGCSACRATCSASVLETIPSCCDCVYQPYCGVCPVVNHALFGDVLPKTSNDFRCRIYAGILDTLFGFILENDQEKIRVLEGWRP